MTDTQSASASVRYTFSFLNQQTATNSSMVHIFTDSIPEVGAANEPPACVPAVLVLVLTCSKWRPSLLKRAGATTM